MRKATLFAVTAALTLACVGGWAGSNTQARVATPFGAGIDLSQVMVHSTHLPSEHYADYSFVFN